MKQFLIDSIDHLDLVVWLLVISFFCTSAMFNNGNIQLAFIGAAGIIIEMMLISLSIEIIIESLKNKRGLGTLIGFITNGPEALCLLVGLWVGDILFAASTPLGSNIMNPIMLLTAAIICGRLGSTAKSRPVYTLITIVITAILAVSFFFIEPSRYLLWLGVAVLATGILFTLRPHEVVCETDRAEHVFSPGVWFPPALIILVSAGYFLDPVVSFAADQSNTPKGLIGFLVLATLTSWPEFKSCMSLLGRNRPVAAILNITVSNITNIWLAVCGIGFYLISL
ncbi:MAG: sodium:proton exchanger [Desulfobulbaceae bacterium]|uniref:Sodium:proton exchanger n=1 Tax=Candidatus Desulfatifera sulfidica TaxID=2841691 RepID=A0A8J6N5N2_9BACT|nr:sodium:proton exchanger [Candidatus Desulfatifera sulfidica]